MNLPDISCIITERKRAVSSRDANEKSQSFYLVLGDFSQLLVSTAIETTLVYRIDFVNN